jgi:hypothetical protein
MIHRRRAIALLGVSLASLGLPSRASAAPRADDAGEPSDGVIRALARINSYRDAAGVSPADLDPALMRSAGGHVAYYEQNLDAGMAGLGLHQQAPDRPGFTGVTMGERASAAGYSRRPVTELAGFGGLVAAADWAMDTVNHRLPLVHPSALLMGLAESVSSGFNVIAVGLQRGLGHAELPSFYPADGASNVPLHWDGGEAPDPAPELPRPLGYPITVCFALGQKVEWQALEVRGPDDQPVEATVRETPWMSAAALISHQPLAHSTHFVVRLSARVDGADVSRETAFQTR